MRISVFVAPLALIASPALAQQPAPAPAPAPQQIVVPPELTDPQMADRLGDMMQAMSKAFLDLPVGEIAAAAEGREPTRADRRRTVRSETRMSERELKQRIDQARPAMQASMKALAEALPAMMKGLTEAAESMERATANLPQPDYPKR